MGRLAYPRGMRGRAIVFSVLASACGRTALDPPAQVARCVESDLDRDGDCSPVPDDCDDGDPGVHPGAMDHPAYDGWEFQRMSLDAETRSVWMAVDARGCVNLAVGTPDERLLLRGTGEGFDVTTIADGSVLAHVAVDARGELHGLVLRGEGSNELFFASRDAAGSWSEERIGHAGGPGGSALVLDRAGDAHVLVAASDPSTNGVFWYGRRSRGWALEEVSGFSQAYDTDLLLDSRGRPHATWSTHWQTPELHHASRPDDGPWRRDQVDEQGDLFGTSGAAIDAGDTLHWAYRVAELRNTTPARPEQAELRYTNSAGVTETIVDGIQPWCIEAAFGPDHLLYVLFIASGLEGSSTVGSVMLAVRHPDGWRVTTLARGEGDAHIGAACALAFDGLGVLHAAWAAGATVRYARGRGIESDARDENCDGVDGIADPCTP